MESIQDILQGIIDRQTSPENLLAIAFEEQLSELGIKITNAQRNAIREHIARRDGAAFSMSLKDYQVPAKLAKKLNGDLSVDLSDLESRTLALMESLSGKFDELIPDLADAAVDIAHRNIIRRKRRLLSMRHSQIREHKKHVATLWGPAIDLLELMVGLADEGGQYFTKELMEGSKEPSSVTHVSMRVLARACQIASEIVCLLRDGYADGAHARWRCLHEMAIVLIFIVDHGEEMAEKYLLHETIESYRAATQYQKYCETLGYLPIPQEQIDELRMTRDELIDRFGKGFDSDYGWASGANNKERPNFSDIEQLVEMNHYRPYYRLASHNVHAGSKGMFYRLGLLPEDRDVLLTGPSVVGLADPGQNTAQSLALLAGAVMTVSPAMDDLVYLKVLQRLCNQTVEAFMSAHRELEGGEEYEAPPSIEVE